MSFCRAILVLLTVLLLTPIGVSWATDAPSADLAQRLTDLEARLAVAEQAATAAKASVDSTAFNTGDNAWVLLGAMLVLFMTIPGLSLFYGGLVRRHHVLGTMMQGLAITAVISVLWACCGFGLAFGPGANGTGGGLFWAGFDYLFLDGVVWSSTGIPGPNGDYAANIPFGTFCFFQLMFAVITPAVLTGAFAERMKFSALVVFSVLWLFLVYIPLAHLVWGKGGALNWGFGATTTAVFDFAGGTVVETASGVSGLVAAIILGKRRRYLQEPMPPHNLALAFTGAALLWIGWFGFNAGSALGAGPLATLACVNTHLAACAATITWPLAEWILRGKPTVLGAISGAVGGLVAITPAAGFVTPTGALMIGAVAGLLCFVACAWLKMKLKYDDSLDVFGVHGVAGMWGTIATGLFFAVDAHPGVKALTSTAVNPQNSGLYERIASGALNPVWGQLIGVGTAVLIAGVGTAVICLAIKYTTGLRITTEQEIEGLDLSQHGEEAYNDRD